MADGTIKQFRFSYYESIKSEESNAFRYIFDKETRTHIPCEEVYAIKFPVGLKPVDRETFCRGIAKISIGSLAYLLKNQGVEEQIISQILSQESIDAIRHFALDLQWTRKSHAMKFSLGQSGVLNRLQYGCENSKVRNHVISISFQEDNSIFVEGMLYSQYGWVLNLSNHVPVGVRNLRLENAITHMGLPDSLNDLTLSPDSICIVNPDYAWEIPNIPQHWEAH